MTVRTVLRLELQLSGPWLIGDPAGTGDVDTVPLREPDGERPQVPATSLAGSLRDHLRRQPDLDERHWMGDRHRSSDDRGEPSRLRVLGVRTSGGARSARRTSTAVDSWTGSARRGTLRREEHVDAPTTVTVYLMHPGAPDPALLAAVAGWRPVVGRRRTNGWGRATVTGIHYGTVDLRDREQLVTWLTGGGPSLVDSLATTPVAPEPAGPVEEEVLSVRCAVVDGLHVGAGEPVETGNDTGREPDRGSRVAGTVTRDGVPYMPAPSWRGVFRAHAGFILRSLGLPDERADESVRELFGGLERRGLLTFHDAPLAEPDTIDLPHVGIDRITGGARPGLLFTERAVRGTLHLRISTDRPDLLPDWARGVLWHTVRDIADGFLAVGGRTTRGLGTLAVLDPLPAADGIDLTQEGE